LGVLKSEKKVLEYSLYIFILFFRTHFRCGFCPQIPSGSVEHADLAGLLSEQQQRCPVFSIAAEDVLADVEKPVKAEDARIDLDEAMDEVAQTLSGFDIEGMTLADREEMKLQMQQPSVQQFTGSQAVLEEAISVMVASQAPVQVGTTQTDARVEYFPVPSAGSQIPALQVITQFNYVLFLRMEGEFFVIWCTRFSP
jgi:hypothetical protein